MIISQQSKKKEKEMLKPRTLQYVTTFDIFKLFLDKMKKNGDFEGPNMGIIWEKIQNSILQTYQEIKNSTEEKVSTEIALKINDVYMAMYFISEQTELPDYIRERAKELAKEYAGCNYIVLPEFK